MFLKIGLSLETGFNEKDDLMESALRIFPRVILGFRYRKISQVFLNYVNFTFS